MFTWPKKMKGLGLLKRLCRRTRRPKYKRLKYLGSGTTARAYVGRIHRQILVVKEIPMDTDIVFCDTEQSRGLEHKHIILHGFYEAYWTWQKYSKDGAHTLCRASSWRIETICASLLMSVNKHLPCDVFLGLTHSWTTRYKRYIAMPFAGKELGEYELSTSRLQSVVLQVMIALYWAQDVHQFKHHDLHSSNVFFHNETVPETWALPDGRLIRLPDTSIRAVIADFGHASLTDDGYRFTRMDVKDLDVGPGWGRWNSLLEGNEGYDLAVLVHSLLGEVSSSNSQVFLWSLANAMKSIHPFHMTGKNRPSGNVRVTMFDLFSHEMFHEMFADVRCSN